MIQQMLQHSELGSQMLIYVPQKTVHLLFSTSEFEVQTKLAALAHASLRFW